MAEPSQITQKQAKKSRAQYDKVGKYQYLLRKFHKVDRRLRAIEVVLRRLTKGPDYSLVFEPEYIQDLACRDEKDKEY